MIKDSYIIAETDNLYIKKFAKTDFRNFLSLHQNPIVMKYFDGGAKTLEQSKKRFNEVMDHQNKYGFSYYNVFLKNSGEYIGQAGLYYNYDMTLNLCYALLGGFQGKGYATEAVVAILKYAFENLKIKSVTAMSAPDNTPSRHLLEKIGAKFERERILFSGMKAFCYSIDKNDFYESIEKIKKYKYREAIGTLLINKDGHLYMFERADFPGSFQGPEGGLNEKEDKLDAAYREILEEIGITKDKIKLLATSEKCFKYNYYEDNKEKHGCVGQEKSFFLFEFLGNDSEFLYNSSNETPEFKGFKLMTKDEALAVVPGFKRDLYKSVFDEFKEFLK